MAKAKRLPASRRIAPFVMTFGVCAACDPRIDQESRDRTANIVETIADIVKAKLPQCTGDYNRFTGLLSDLKEELERPGYNANPVLNLLKEAYNNLVYEGCEYLV